MKARCSCCDVAKAVHFDAAASDPTSPMWNVGYCFQCVQMAAAYACCRICGARHSYTLQMACAIEGRNVACDECVKEWCK